MPTDQQIVTALAKACGWHDYLDAKSPRLYDEVGRERNPLTSHDDAMVVQERLCGDEELAERYYALFEGKFRSTILHLSPSDRCRALFAALPDCGECKGSGWLGDGTERGASWDCNTCSGTGKATADPPVFAVAGGAR